MATKATTRCSISVKDSVYARIKSCLDSHGGGSIAGFCEEVIAEKLGNPTDAEIQAYNASIQEIEVSTEDGTPLAEVRSVEVKGSEPVSEPLRLEQIPPTPVSPAPAPKPLPDGWEDYVPPILIL